MLEVVLNILFVVFMLGTIVSLATDASLHVGINFAGMYTFGMLAIGEVGVDGGIMRVFAELPTRGVDGVILFFFALLGPPAVFIIMGFLVVSDEKKGVKP